MRRSAGVMVALVAISGAVLDGACALPDDFVKVEGGLGGGGQGGAGGGECAPFTLDAPDACDPSLISDEENCCVMGRSCGDADCSDGRCDPADVDNAPDEALGVLLLDDERVIWATGYGNRLLSAPLTGGPSTILYEDDTYVTMLATDGDRVFFTRYGNGEVWSVDPYEGSASAMMVSDNSGHESWFGRIAVDDAFVYWVSQDDDGNTPAVWFAPKDGGSAAAISVGGYPVGVTSDDTHVYWTDEGLEEVRRCPVNDLEDCPSVEVFATDQASPSEIVVQDDVVYWLASGALYARSTEGGATTILADSAVNSWGLALDATHAYWTSNGDGQVFRTPLDGTSDTVEIAGYQDALGIAVGCDAVVFTTSLGDAEAHLLRIPK